MTKYRLKKDTPEFKAGTVFDMIENIDVGKVLTMNAPREDDYSFEVDSIDNFDEWFEEVKLSSWEMPTRGDNYYFINDSGVIVYTIWMDNSQDRVRYLMGNCFRTTEAADRFANYLKAMATVRQDEGILTTKEAHEQCDNGNRAYCLMPSGTVYNTISIVAPGGIYFKDTESAGASWDAHHKEWQTIINYDWSRE